MGFLNFKITDMKKSDYKNASSLIRKILSKDVRSYSMHNLININSNPNIGLEEYYSFRQLKIDMFKRIDHYHRTSEELMLRIWPYLTEADIAIRPFIDRPTKGGKTVFYEGQYYDYDPEGLPF